VTRRGDAGSEFEFTTHDVGPLVNLGLFFGSVEKGAEALRFIRDFLSRAPDNVGAQLIGLNAPPAPFVPEQFHFAPCYGLAVVADFLPRKASPMSIMPVFPLAGAFARVGVDDAAFGGPRVPMWVFNIAAVAPDPDLLATDREWVRSFWEALLPYASSVGGYVNFLNDVDDERVRESYGAAKYDRLARVRAEYDPDNCFHKNANIKPAVAV
jgi:FAD/FMN-containing dehydrogenase